MAPYLKRQGDDNNNILLQTQLPYLAQHPTTHLTIFTIVKLNSSQLTIPPTPPASCARRLLIYHPHPSSIRHHEARRFRPQRMELVSFPLLHAIDTGTRLIVGCPVQRRRLRLRHHNPLYHRRSVQRMLPAGAGFPNSLCYNYISLKGKVTNADDIRALIRRVTIA